MTLRDDILTRFSNQPTGEPPYLPDLTLWYKWHREHSTLPEAWQSYTLPQVSRALGAPIWMVARPWHASTPGIPITTETTGVERVTRYEAFGRVLTARWALGPDGDWWQVEYPVKTIGDLVAARAIIEARTYTLEASDLVTLQQEIGEDGVLALEVPMRPYSDILHTLLGWSEGLTLFAGEGRSALLEMIEILEEKLQALTAQVTALPGDLILAPDNLDGQYISPRVFHQHLAESYVHTAAITHRRGKRLVVHVGGPVRYILPLLAEAGVDGVEGIAGPPQGDLSLAEARQIAGPGLTLWGGIPQDLLNDIHSSEEFEGGVVEALRQVRRDGRTILGIADKVPVDADTSRLERIARLVRPV